MYRLATAAMRCIFSQNTAKNRTAEITTSGIA